MVRRATDIQDARTADDGGYILTMAGLILVSLVIVVGFAVDIGGLVPPGRADPAGRRWGGSGWGGVDARLQRR